MQKPPYSYDIERGSERRDSAVVELDTLVSLAKGTGWLDTDDEIDADGVSTGSVV